jgi:hypothetical protein
MTSIASESKIEYGFIGKLTYLKYTYRSDIRDRTALEQNRGFCLIFRPINGAIKQFEFRRKRGFRRKTANSFAKEMSYQVSNEFKFIDIQYLQKVKQSNAFLHMPVAVSGDAKNEAHREQIRKEQESHYAQKSVSWKYETEARLILSPPPSWLFGEHVHFTNQERLFHYDPCHLVGIIYGTRMTENQKERIREILKERDDWNLYYPNYKNGDFNFMEFDAILSSNERALDIVPYAISTYQRIYAEDKNFEKLYKEWREYIGFENSRDE